MPGSIPPHELTRSIPERFHEIVERFPDRPAVQYDRGEIRYRALGDRARSVAALIRAAAPATPGAVVILTRQGIPQIAAILGVLEAGDWYVPLDPKMSADALGDLIARAEAKLMLTDEATRAIAERAAGGVCPVACVDGALPAPLTERSPATPDSLAYVYFTSGTTGAPKGVMDSHRNVIHNILRYSHALRWTHHDRFTLLQASHFSGAVSNVFGALLHGALLLPYDVDRDGAGPPLQRWVQFIRPTIFHSVPSLYRSIMFSWSRFPGVRVVRLEGDAASRLDVHYFNRNFHPGAQLVHGLGATETGIACQYFHVQGERPMLVLPIGQATTDVKVQVVHEDGVIAAPGEVGEIVVRSRYLALGYWKDPERTAQAFSSDPSDSEVRSYRTGDLGRIREDGHLEHLGRRDRQLKVRGQWVDAAAVEAALEGMPSVREAVVGIAAKDFDDALTAWLVPDDESALDATGLRRELARQLPSHAVPGHFRVIDSLPLGPNGKRDRTALGADLGRPIRDGGGFAPPRNEREAELVEIWKRILQIGQLGIHDRFLELGGDSLKAVAVSLAIEQQLRITVPHSTLAEAPTVAELAERLEIQRTGMASRVLIPIETTGHRQPLFCVHDLESSSFLFASLSRWLSAHPVFALTPPVGEPLCELPRTIETLAARYLEEIARVAPDGPYALAGFCFGGVVALEMARQLRERGEEVNLLALINVTAYDLPALVSERARTRFRTRWGARIRYLSRKPDRWRWIVRRVLGTAEKSAGRATLPLRLAMSPDDAPATPTLVRASLVSAFDRYRARPHAGEVHLFVADDNLPLYADDPHEAWQGAATGLIHIHRFPHDGYAMLSEPDVGRVARILAQVLG
jgi:amino acid adenylation domain-containing protein